MRKWKRWLPAYAVVAALGLSLSACSNSDKPLASIAATSTTTSSTTATSSTTTTTTTNSTTKPTVTTKPAVDSKVPNQTNARKNVDLINCAATANGWSAGGTVVNPSSQPTTYAISVNFTSSGEFALANASTSVTVPAGKTRLWSVNAAFNAPILVLCVLRGVTTS